MIYKYPIWILQLIIIEKLNPQYKIIYRWSAMLIRCNSFQLISIFLHNANMLIDEWVLSAHGFWMICTLRSLCATSNRDSSIQALSSEDVLTWHHRTLMRHVTSKRWSIGNISDICRLVSGVRNNAARCRKNRCTIIFNSESYI